MAYKDQSRRQMMDIWVGMIARCTKPVHVSFSRYGGRGIAVCDRWFSFDRFLEDMGPRPTPKHSLDRIDNDGPYSPENCRWATSEDQARSRSTTVHVTIDGVTDSLTGWARQRGVSPQALNYRMKRLGLTAEEALAMPASRQTRHAVDWSSISRKETLK